MSSRVTLDSPAMRVAISVPVAVLTVYVVAADQVARPGLVASLLGVGVALALWTLWRSTRAGGVPRWQQLLVGLLGVGLLPGLVVEGIAAPAATFALIFVLILVVAAYTMHGAARAVLFAWTLLMWLGALWWDGLREPDLLLLQLGGGVFVLVTVSRTAGALGREAAAEARDRVETERRAELLARLLQVHTLEREEVLDTVVDSLLDGGFDAATLRVLDDGELRLAVGRGAATVEMPERLSRHAGIAGRALDRGRPEVVGPDTASVVGLSTDVAGAVAVPVVADGDPLGVLTGLSRSGPVTDAQLTTVELVASLAGRVLRRAELYEADERTVAELQRLEARTQDFVSTVSHELRTPLTVVQGLGQMLSTRWDDLRPERRDDLLRRIEANAGRLAQMVRSLLDTSAFEEGRIEVQSRSLPLASLVRDLLHRLASVTAAHPVELAVPDTLRVHADPALLEHVLENLLANAAKHTPQGTRVRIEARPVGDGVEVVVSDDGPGIPADDLPHVLDRFYRGGEPTARPPGGLGLGLALACDILEAHDSELRLHSVEGVGTRFAFVLADPASGATRGGGHQEADVLARDRA